MLFELLLFLESVLRYIYLNHEVVRFGIWDFEFGILSTEFYLKLRITEMSFPNVLSVISHFLQNYNL